MIILGIDPGLTRCGYGFIEKTGPRTLQFMSVGVAMTAPDIDLQLRIEKIADELERVIETHKPDVIALERVFAQANRHSVMGVAQISGVVLYLAARNRIPVSWFTPTQVKAAITGSGRANKEQVGFMVAKLLGLSTIPQPADAADSLAIAITQAWNGASAASSAVKKTKAQETWLAAESKAKRPGK